jgi:hypothetical protein
MQPLQFSDSIYCHNEVVLCWQRYRNGPALLASHLHPTPIGLPCCAIVLPRTSGRNGGSGNADLCTLGAAGGRVGGRACTCVIAGRVLGYPYNTPLVVKVAFSPSKHCSNKQQAHCSQLVQDYGESCMGKLVWAKREASTRSYQHSCGTSGMHGQAVQCSSVKCTLTADDMSV